MKIYLLIFFGFCSLYLSGQNKFELYLSKSYENLNSKDFVLATEYINLGLEEFPDSIIFHILKGQLQIKEGNIDLAIISFSKAIELDATSDFAFYNRSKAHKLKGDLVLMCEDILTAINLGEYIYTRPFSDENCGEILDMGSPDSKYTFPPPPPEKRVD